MRTYLLALLLGFVTLAPVARADTYEFTFSGVIQPNIYAPVVYPTLSFSWQISGPPQFFLFAGYEPAYEYTSVPLPGFHFDPNANLVLFSVSDPISPQYGVLFYSTGTDIDSLYDFAGLSTSESFYKGPESNPAFLPGTYQAEFEYHDYTIYDGTLSVSDVGTVTPEPSTVALLGTGLMGVGALRRRLMQG